MISMTIFKQWLAAWRYDTYCCEGLRLAVARQRGGHIPCDIVVTSRQPWRIGCLFTWPQTCVCMTVFCIAVMAVYCDRHLYCGNLYW